MNQHEESRWYEYPGKPISIKGGVVRIHYGSSSALVNIRASKTTLDAAEKQWNLKRRYPEQASASS